MSRDPSYYHLSLGAGGLLIHQQKVLLVQVNYGRAKGAWILPGGMVERGESPERAVEREVFEETGLRVSANGLLALRHRLYEDEFANIYMVFHVQSNTPLEVEPKLTWPEHEIICAKFWEVSEALQNEMVRPMTREFIKYATKDSSRVWLAQDLPRGHNYKDLVFS